MKLLVTLEVAEIIGLISSFLLYVHRWQHSRQTKASRNSEMPLMTQ